MSSELGLNDHHQATVINYLRFSRYQKAQRLRGVKSCFQELEDSRLVEDTYTLDEVADMFDGLMHLVLSEIDGELINATHTNVLLLRQLFQQAEKWHLKLTADISELENRELLDAIKDFEEKEFTGTKRDGDIMTMPKLIPLTGGAGLLEMEINRINEENKKLRERLQSLENTAIDGQKQRHDLSEDLANTRSQLSREQMREAGVSNQEVDDLRRQMDGLKNNMHKREQENKSYAEGINNDLTETKHELLRIQELLDLREKDLEKKVSCTAPYRNLKQMLHKKNDQIKQLRHSLSKYEDDTSDY